MTAAELRDACRVLGLSHRDIAKIIGVNERHFRRQCGGSREVSLAVESAVTELLRRAREVAL